MTLTGVNADAAAGAADEEAGSIFLQVRCGCWLLRVRVFLCGGGEAHLWDQRLGPHPPSLQEDGTLCTVSTFGLTAAGHRKQQLSAGSGRFADAG